MIDFNKYTDLIVCLDSATTTGYSVIKYNRENKNIAEHYASHISFALKKATKKIAKDLPEKRYGEFGKWLRELINTKDEFDNEIKSIIIAYEEPKAFTRGKAAVEVANRFIGIIEDIAYNNKALLIRVTPQDLKKFATGRGNADKDEMTMACINKYGYHPTDDNEADAFLLSKLIIENINTYIKNEN